MFRLISSIGETAAKRARELHPTARHEGPTMHCTLCIAAAQQRVRIWNSLRIPL